jgi:glycosyltransferase involved in cell wall biosynthesis
MARFLFFLPRFHTNAAPWVRILTSSGHQVSVVVSHVGPTESHAIATPKPVSPSSLTRLFGGRHVAPIDKMPGIKQVWRRIRADAPDVVIVRGASRWLSRVAIACALLQRRKLVIYDQEDVSPRALGTRLRRAAFKAIGIPHFTVRIGPDGARRNFSDAIAIPFGKQAAELPQSAAPAGEAAPRILMVAKYRQRKGHLQLLDAMSIVARSSSCSLVFCGEEASVEDGTYCDLLRRYVHQLGLEKRVTFRNNVPYARMADLYAEHDVFVLPSRNEPAAVSPIEAAWCGCAVLISSDSGTRGYLPPGEDYEFDPADPADIARAILGVVASREDLATHKARCRSYIERVAGESLILHRFEGLLPSHLVENPPGPARHFSRMK